MAQEALLTPNQHKQLAKIILAIANGDEHKYELTQIQYCQDIVKKVAGSDSDYRIATGKISSKLNKLNFKHSEADLKAIASLL